MCLISRHTLAPERRVLFDGLLLPPALAVGVSVRPSDIRRGALHRNRFTNGKRKEVGEDNVPPHSHMLACVSYYWSILYTYLLLVNCLNLCMVTPNAWSCCLCMHGLSSSHWSCLLQLLPVPLRWCIVL